MADPERERRANRREHQQPSRLGLLGPRFQKIDLLLRREQSLAPATPMAPARGGGAAKVETGLHSIDRRRSDPKEIRRCLQRQPHLGGQQDRQGRPKVIKAAGRFHGVPGFGHKFQIDLDWSCHGHNIAHLRSS